MSCCAHETQGCAQCRNVFGCLRARRCGIRNECGDGQTLASGLAFGPAKVASTSGPASFSAGTRPFSPVHASSNAMTASRT